MNTETLLSNSYLLFGKNCRSTYNNGKGGVGYDSYDKQYGNYYTHCYECSNL